MKLSARSWWLGPLVVLALLLSPAVGLSQEGVGEDPQARPAGQQGTVQEGEGEETSELDAVLGTGAVGEDAELINVLLAADEDQRSGGFAYDDGGRRDPFISLIRPPELDQIGGDEIPPGVPGLIIDELTIEGVWITQEGPVAQVRSARERLSLLIRPGDVLYDGRVVSINFSRGEGAEVVFRQRIMDPDAPKPFREVSRRID